MAASLVATIEAILYLKAKPLKLGEIVAYAQCERGEAETALAQLVSAYDQREGALEVVKTGGQYSLQLRSQFQDLVKTLVPVDLGLGALRTLAAIALKGSISQTDLVELRGSGAYQHVQTLVEQGFIRKRRQKDGRSYWLQVTDKFHQYFQTEKLPHPLEKYAGFGEIAKPKDEVTPE
jgi:segregation and condensation protein B